MREIDDLTTSYPETRLGIQALERLPRETTVSEQTVEDLLVFSLWLENPLSSGRIARIFNLTKSEVKMRVNRVRTETAEIGDKFCELYEDLVDQKLAESSAKVPGKRLSRGSALTLKPTARSARPPVTTPHVRSFEAPIGPYNPLAPKEQQIKWLRLQRYTNSQITGMITTPYTTVSSVTNRLSSKGEIPLTQKHRSKDDVRLFGDKVLLLKKQGLSYVQIAGVLKADSDLVRDALHRLTVAGLVSPSRPPDGKRLATEIFDGKVKRLIKAGYSNPQIAEQLKVPYTRVTTAKNRLSHEKAIPSDKLDEEQIERLEDLVAAISREPVTKRYLIEEVLREFSFLYPDQPVNLAEIGRLIGCTREYVRQLHEKLKL